MKKIFYTIVLLSNFLVHKAQSPIIISQPEGFNICPGQSDELQIAYEGSSPISVEWYLIGNE
ncbi:MAG: hypothetical protein RI930_373, partial [Pseudomonadota bacterium]